MPAVRIVGAGRAGRSLAGALERVAGWRVEPILGRADDLTDAASSVEFLVLAVPDEAVADVAAGIEPVDSTVVVHLAGALALDILAPHPRRASVHPLVSLPEPDVGAARLAAGAWFAVAGDPVAFELVNALGGHAFVIDDADRVTYHAAACIASNHLVALLGQAERVARRAGVPFDAYLELARSTLDNVAALGPGQALTGPVARGDWSTVTRHVASLDPPERPAYEAMANAAATLAGVERSRAAAGGELRVIDRIDALRKELDAERAAGRTVGLVPTMGYLHEGHASLMRRAREECDVVVATVFVNPLQFGPREDLEAYPRDLDRDLEVARSAGVDLLFVPSVEEMYPEPVLTTVGVAELSSRMEGAARPTHFAGVATVVTKLFAIAGPGRAYFGEKDYQQLAVVRRMAADLSLPVLVVGCPTVREPDGLAMSSRNVYLSPEERAAAPVLHRALLGGAAAIEAGEREPARVCWIMTSTIATEPLVELDYAEVVDAHDLTVPQHLSGELRLLIAARLGRTRLIDNLGVSI